MRMRKNRVNYFVLTEIVMAMGLMVLLYTCYYASTKAIAKMDKAFTDDTRSLMVINNTIERLEHKKYYNNDDIKMIFMDEFNKSGFADNSKIVPKMNNEPGWSRLSILKANGKAVIEVKIKCQK